MFILTEDFKAIQRAPSARPHVTLNVRDFRGNAPRPRWTRLYTGSEPDEEHSMAIAASGALTRIRTDTTPSLWRQYTGIPDVGSDWATWTSWLSPVRNCAIAASVNELRAFAVLDTFPAEIYEAVSVNGGSSWTAFAPSTTAAGAVTAIAAAGDGTGRFLLVWAVGPTLYKRKYSAGAWGAAAAWPNTVNSITGVTVSYRGDWNIVLTGTEQTTANPTVWQLRYGDGYSQAADTWSALEPIVPASAGANVVFDSPFLATDGASEWLTYGESYTGAGGYNRNWWSHNTGDFVNGGWLEGVPFNQTNNNQLALAYSSPYLWASTPFGVWRASISAPLLDLSKHLTAFEVHEAPWSTRGTIDLDNSAGTFGAPGAGDTAALRLGSEVRLTLGYRVPDGPPLQGQTLVLNIHGWEHIVAPGQATFRLHVRGPEALLEGLRPRSSRQWLTGTRNYFQIASHLFARAGITYSTFTSTSALVNVQPAFTVHPGETILTALKRLYGPLEDAVLFSNGDAISLWPRATDPSAYSYGGNGAHPIEAITSETQVPDHNYVQALAGAILGEAIDWPSIDDVYARTAVTPDKTSTTEAQADDHATAVLREAQIAASPCSITVPMNVGHELHDVVEITEPRAGLIATKRRITAITWRYNPAKARYHQALTLGAV